MGAGGWGSVMLERGPPPRGLDVSRRLRATAAENDRWVLRKSEGANKLLRGRGLGIARGARRAFSAAPREQLFEGRSVR